MMENSVEDGQLVTMETFIGHWHHPGMEKFLELTDSDGENPVQIFGLIDESGDGKLDADEFVEMCGRLMGNAKAMQVKKDIFALRDEDGDGRLAAGEISKYYGGRCYQGSPGIAPGMIVGTPCDGMHVFKPEKAT